MFYDKTNLLGTKFLFSSCAWFGGNLYFCFLKNKFALPRTTEKNFEFYNLKYFAFPLFHASNFECAV